MKIFSSKTIRANGDAKTVKGTKYSDYITAIMYLAPADNLAIDTGKSYKTLCPFAEQAGCTKACLFKAGRGQMSSVERARLNKTKWFMDDREGFMAQLAGDIQRFVNWCKRQGKRPTVRLNGTSDILWERIPVGDHANIMEMFPEVQFYDYTKVTTRVYRELPANYALTLSYSQANPEYAQRVVEAHLETGTNMAVVYRTKEMRDAAVAASQAHRIIDGDKTDLRFLDGTNKVVGLFAKGPAKHDTTGFVIDAA